MLSNWGDTPLIDPERDLLIDPSAGPLPDSLAGLAVAHATVLRRVHLAGLTAPLADGRTRIGYPVLPAIAALYPPAEAQLGTGVRMLMAALHQILRAFRSDPELADFLAVPAAAAAFWISDQPRPEELTIDLCGSI